MSEKCIIDPERDCLGLMKARELEKDLNDLRKQNSSSHERIFDRLGELEKQEGIQVVQYEHILEKLDAMAGDVKELKEKPGKRWEGIVKNLIEIVAAAVAGFFLAKFGL